MNCNPRTYKRVLVLYFYFFRFSSPFFSLQYMLLLAIGFFWTFSVWLDQWLICTFWIRRELSCVCPFILPYKELFLSQSRGRHNSSQSLKVTTEPEMGLIIITCTSLLCVMFLPSFMINKSFVSLEAAQRALVYSFQTVVQTRAYASYLRFEECDYFIGMYVN